MNWDVTAELVKERKGCSDPQSLLWVNIQWMLTNFSPRMRTGPPCFPCWVSWHCYENIEKTTNLQDFPADRWAKWAPSHTTTPPHCAVTPAFLWIQFFTTGGRNSKNILFLPISLYVRAECGSVCLYPCTEGPKQFLCILWLTPEGSQTNLTHSAGSWDVAMIHVRKQPWSSMQQFQLGNETQRSVIWAGCNPSAHSLVRKWNMPFLRTNTVSPTAKQLPLYALPFEWKQNWTLMPITSSSEAAAWTWGWPQATPSVALSLPLHKHRDLSCTSRKQTSLQRPMRMQRQSAQQKWPN